MERTFAQLVEEVRELSPEERLELKLVIDRSLVEERRREIGKNYDESLAEYRHGGIELSSDLAGLRRSLGS